MKAKMILMLAATAGMLAVSPAVAQERDQDQDRMQEMDLDQLRDRGRIYGYDLMTLDEHDELFRRLDEAQTEQERTRIMQEHRQAMQERVRALLGVIGGGRGAGGPSGGGKGSRKN